MPTTKRRPSWPECSQATSRLSNQKFLRRFATPDRPNKTLKSLGELGFVKLLERFPLIGDDAALLDFPDGQRIVAAADMLVEGTHFRLDWSSPQDIGYKAAAVNMSDMAAMGAQPFFMLISLGAPANTSVDVVDGIYEGLEESGVQIAGGDTVQAPQLVISVAMLGTLKGPGITRKGASPGDILAVTGPLGKADAGLRLLQAGVREGPCVDAHRRPVARLQTGQKLTAAGVTTGLDLSDGLATDCRRLGVGIELDAEKIPIAAELLELDWDPFELALCGAEDYELLVALPPGFTEDLDLIIVGRVVAEGHWLVRDGHREPLEECGWRHFE